MINWDRLFDMWWNGYVELDINDIFSKTTLQMNLNQYDSVLTDINDDLFLWNDNVDLLRFHDIHFY